MTRSVPSVFAVAALAFSVLATLAGTAAPVHAATAHAVPVLPVTATAAASQEMNLLLAELMLDKQPLSDVINIYEVRNDTLLPIGELARLLTIGVTVDPVSHVASGFLAREDQLFRLDTEKRSLYARGKTLRFAPWQVQWIDGELYVAKSLIQQSWPVDFDLDMSTLRLTARPREKLPIQLRAEREREAELINRQGQLGLGPVYPRLANDYDLISVPFIDNTLALDARKSDGGIAVNTAYSGFLTGDLLGMEASGYFSISKADPTPRMRLTLGRHDPAGMLGRLQARSIEFGDISLPSVRNVMGGGGGGNGWLISNRPFDLGNSYGLQTLRGSLPPGWDVSLYVNDALVDFQSGRPDGQYEFRDLALVFGRTEFRLVFNGPLGERRVERQVYQLDQMLTAPGKIYYGIAGKRESDGTLRQIGQFDIGLMRNVAATASLVAVDRAGGTAARHYLVGGARVALAGALFNVDYSRDLKGGDALEIGARTVLRGVALDVARLWANGFASEMLGSSDDPVRLRDRIGLNGTIALSDVLRLPFALDARREVLRSGRSSLTVQQRLSANVLRTNFTNSIGWSRSGGSDTVEGSLQMSHRVAGVGVSGQLAYQLMPKARLSSLALNMDKMLGAYDRLNLGLLRNFAMGSTMVTGGMNHRFGQFAIGVSGFYGSRRNFGAGLTLFTAFGRDPGSGRILQDWQPMAASAMITAHAFIDTNDNHRFDSGEDPVPGATFTINGGNRSEVKTDSQGRATISRLPPRTFANIAINPASLEDVQWQPGVAGVRILSRPGKAMAVDFPIVLTAEIDGVVRLAEGNGRRGIGNATLELLDDLGAIITTTKSASDGFFIVPAVRPGHYRLRVSPDQLRKLGLSVDREAAIMVNPRGDYVSGMDFVVTRLRSASAPEAAGPDRPVAAAAVAGKAMRRITVRKIRPCALRSGCAALRSGFAYQASVAVRGFRPAAFRQNRGRWRGSPRLSRRGLPKGWTARFAGRARWRGQAGRRR